ncbi:2-oxoglutarate (2OG) and Fe(II)-dependent oxygenase superfamily protein [Quillaja saponaria]|uniref:2-oxoglutarate (2OG) and Fe(II)-dependent oxygenase superfamily protein n=1 Tax=Quillaja saponaria TaxID=32244 RepID=A0AAD7QCH7_QUISA|nr:2-oxoglutarate (2OG) and Fe(II)-dependent oxygenase superfamily protein [Quillaja saponaria]
MEPKPTNLGSSLLVPSVQELTKETLSTVPSRYVRLDQDPPIISKITSLPEVPVIDLTKLFSEDFKEFELEKLHSACKNWGFFQIINHGVSPSLVEKVKTGIHAFFNLPMEEKTKFWQKTGDMEGFGQAFVVSEEQKLDWADMFYLISLPAHMRKPHLFPQLALPFKDTLESYSIEMKNLATKILDFIAESLKIDDNYIKDSFEEGLQMMRMNYYPPCPQPDLVIGLNPHSDAVGLTILLQVNEMEGLQIRKDGIWIPVKALPNAFIVNIGEILELLNFVDYDKWNLSEHRDRATVNSEKERLSVATFYSPKMDGNIGPATSLITPERPALFKRIGVEDYFKGLFSRELRGKSYLDVLRIKDEDVKSI